MSSPIDQAAGRALRFARFSKALVWLVAMAIAAIIALFLAQAGLFALLLPSDVVPPVPVTNPDQITAVTSTVHGVDRENQPYEVTAARGWQDEAIPTLVHLETVDGRFRRATGAEYTVQADTGAYDTKVKTLDLAGNVVIVQKDRFTARMDKAHVVVEEKKLTSDVPVDVSFATGSVRANGIEITDDGARILFRNGVKAAFNAVPAKGDAKP
jgi:lipopolysaccharide export system protein LptC